MKALVAGYGSIGARHARLLADLGCEVSVVSNRPVDFPRVYAGLAAALTNERPDYVVVANATGQHHATLQELANLGFQGIVLLEKPAFERVREVPGGNFKRILIGYNLRLHPVIQRLHALLQDEKPLSVLAYAGQHLPDWRPESDYRLGYSARNEGGGVLRDLSHELDYLLWMLGGWSEVSAIQGHFSRLEIASDDVCALMLATPACPAVSVQLNYLDRPGRRFVIVNTEHHTIEADLLAGTLRIDRQPPEKFPVDRDQTYREMHRRILSSNFDSLCALEEGLEVMRLIDAAEQSARDRNWIKR